jgi:hypothetical protein
MMNRSVIHLIGILFLIAAVVAAVLNLHRVADLRMPWLAPLLLIVGMAVVLIGKRRA